MGEWDVEHLKQTIPCEVFDRWKLFFLRSPFDPETMFALPAASICATLININRGNRPPISVRDLLPKRTATRPEPEALDDKLKQRFLALMKSPPPEDVT